MNEGLWAGLAGGLGLRRGAWRSSCEVLDLVAGQVLGL